MRGKTANPELAARQRAAAAGESAVAAEAWADLVGLDGDPRRKHIHWTHVRTSNLADRQPESFTRQGFFEHLRTVYEDVYPEPANPSGSILLFGAVAKERHAQSKDEECRAEHHHAQVFCSTHVEACRLPFPQRVARSDKPRQWKECGNGNLVCLSRASRGLACFSGCVLTKFGYQFKRHSVQ